MSKRTDRLRGVEFLTMPTQKVSSKAARLLIHHRALGRAFPRPRYWERLYQLLEEEAERRGRTPPPPPLLHSADHTPGDDEKMERLVEQVRWADTNRLLHRIEMFFDTMPPSAWFPRR